MNEMQTMLARDTISGREARAYIVINGRREDLFFAKSLEATVTKNKTEVNVLSVRSTQHKANGWSGEGSMTIYYATSIFRKMMLEYIRTGKDIYFDTMVTNEDPTSTIGSQTTILQNCNLDSVIMAKFDTESETLDEDIDFTFDGVDMLDEFNAPQAQ